MGKVSATRLGEMKLAIFENYMYAIIENGDCDDDTDIAADMAREWVEELTTEQIIEEYEGMTE